MWPVLKLIMAKLTIFTKSKNFDFIANSASFPSKIMVGNHTSNFTTDMTTYAGHISDVVSAGAKIRQLDHF